MSATRWISACALGTMVSLVSLAAPAAADPDNDKWERKERRHERREEWRKDRREMRGERRDDRARDADALIRRAEEAADEFREDFNEELDDSSLNGTDREDDLNDQVNQLENALDALRREYDDDDEEDADDWDEARREVRKVVVESRDVDRLMGMSLWSRDLRSQWREVENAIRQIENVFGSSSSSWNRNPPRR